jgi:hypothetical protein
MAERKVYIKLEVKMIMRVDEAVNTEDIVNELDYSFSDTTGHASIEDTEIVNYEVMDSK